MIEVIGSHVDGTNSISNNLLSSVTKEFHDIEPVI